MVVCEVYDGVREVMTKKGHQISGEEKVHPRRKNPGYAYDGTCVQITERCLQPVFLTIMASAALNHKMRS